MSLWFKTLQAKASSCAYIYSSSYVRLVKAPTAALTPTPTRNRFKKSPDFTMAQWTQRVGACARGTDTVTHLESDSDF